ncbi:MAG: hypothetical protein KDA87_06415 [Planctomycetales bacterium]|nr:hypothetical protein [Planctomycetales bacterium]
MNFRCYSQLVSITIALLLSCNIVRAQLLLDGGGLLLVQEGPAVEFGGDPVPDNLAIDGTAFASSELGPELGIAYHFIDNLNDGFYGNEFSWIGGDDNPFLEAFAGIDLGASPVSNVQSIAFGRSNVLTGDSGCGGAVCIDRHQGFYALQYTQVPNPSFDLDFDTTGNPATGWADIGTLEYGVSDGAGTNYNNTWQRHRYNFDPVDATGIRLVVPGTGIGGGTAIDEIELYDVAGEFVPPPPPPLPVTITPAAGFQIEWDGTDGEYFDPESPPDGAIVPDNLALATNGAEAFSSSDLGPELGIDFHVAENLNDGFYGNANSWIGGTDNPFAPDAFAGISLSAEQRITSVAWSRDNGNDFADACGGQCTDRALGTYTLQFTRTANPDADTQATGNAETGWQDLGQIGYAIQNDEFAPYLRHEYLIDDGSGGVLATGIRILVPNTGLSGGTAIDEIEIYGGLIANVCDVNSDGMCDVADIDAISQAIRNGESDARFDVNQDGSVSNDDRTHWVVELQQTWFGDSNFDGEFNSSDFVAVFQTRKFETGEAATWATGDWNGDGEFDSSDFVAAFTDGGYELGPRTGVASVPEPNFGVWSLFFTIIAVWGHRIRGVPVACE